jgi:GAF domain-containing protein
VPDHTNQVTSIARRYRALLNVNRLALSTFTIDEIFGGVCTVLRALLVYDRAGLAIYDPDQDSLKIEATYGFHQNSAFQVGYRMPKNSSQAFDCRNPIIRRDLEKDFRTSTEKQIANEGYRSLCSVPLILRNNCIGVVTVVSKRRNQFLVRHSQLVQEMSNQIALAILSMT